MLAPGVTSPPTIASRQAQVDAILHYCSIGCITHGATRKQSETTRHDPAAAPQDGLRDRTRIFLLLVLCFAVRKPSAQGCVLHALQRPALHGSSALTALG